MVITVTNGGWSVSTVNNAGPGFRLNVHRQRVLSDRVRYQRADHDGRFFWTRDEASAFALERGYLQPFRKAKHATFRRTHRKALRALHRWALQSLAIATTGQDLVRIADAIGEAIRRETGDPLLGLTWSAGFWTAVHRLRPEIMARASQNAEHVA